MRRPCSAVSVISVCAPAAAWSGHTKRCPVARASFAEYVGVGSKWVIRRYRLHDAAAAASGTGDLDLVRLAADLGYSDQAHLTRDFTDAVGMPPSRYVR